MSIDAETKFNAMALLVVEKDLLHKPMTFTLPKKTIINL
jgi:hypothetical protein